MFCSIKGNINAEQGAKLKEKLKSMWNAYFAPADVDKDGRVTCDELVTFIKQVHSIWVHPICFLKYILSTINRNIVRYP
jgi:hypothetical protein